ncbi:MAG: 4Fe-4S dicluster domain-containing protein [Lachnospiraceae bacterium]|nr:4Fe-4S dicluster domain-containing protein [Lachnospiraceae bacterium]
MGELVARAKEMLADGTVQRVAGWKKGDLGYNPEPAYFTNAEEMADFVYDGFCGANLSKYMIEASAMEGRTLVFLKPCDTYSFNQLLMEHRVKRDKIYIIGVGCSGKLDINKIQAKGIKGIRTISEEDGILKFDTIYGEKECPRSEVLLGRCHVCKGKDHQVYDELIGESEETTDQERFAEVERIEAMTPQERFAFFRSELSKCIRCNACRNVCPACSCRKCVFDSNKFDSSQKANADTFEEQMFHIIRAFHVAGRCTDCGECSRVCPQGIPLHLFNRKFIKDINTFYGEYQAGAATDCETPLTDFTFDDVEPGVVAERGHR